MAGPSEADRFQVQTLPDAFAALASYQWRINRELTVMSRVAGRFYGRSTLYEAMEIFEIRVGPAYNVSEGVVLLFNAGGYGGSFTGFEVGGGLEISL